MVKLTGLAVSMIRLKILSQSMGTGNEITCIYVLIHKSNNNHCYNNNKVV